ncbi:hypothetical protein J6590_047175 [Homalodisca vitripennis]|nr:hypothetical protein J6590_047175 [Homalodisca vitripennis]
MQSLTAFITRHHEKQVFVARHSATSEYIVQRDRLSRCHVTDFAVFTLNISKSLDDGYFTADAVLSKNRMYAGADQTVSANISWLPRVNTQKCRNPPQHPYL